MHNMWWDYHSVISTFLVNVLYSYFVCYIRGIVPCPAPIKYRIRFCNWFIWIILQKGSDLRTNLAKNPAQNLNGFFANWALRKSCLIVAVASSLSSYFLSIESLFVTDLQDLPAYFLLYTIAVCLF